MDSLVTPTTEAPADWNDAVKAAGLLFLGRSANDVAAEVGVSVKTLWVWRRSEWWSAAQVDAQDAQMDRMVSLARGNILAALEAGDVKVSQWLLERADILFSDPRIKAEVQAQMNARTLGGLSKLSEDELRKLLDHAENGTIDIGESK